MVKKVRRGMTKEFPYQRVGIKALHKKFKGRGLLADEMGLGKTLQALRAAIELRKKELRLFRAGKRKAKPGPLVVVCPAGLKDMWQKQISLHTHLRSEVLTGRTVFKRPHWPKDVVYIANYEILGSSVSEAMTWNKKLLKMKPFMVLVDEGHYIKSPDAQRTHHVKQLCEKIRYVVIITGTPLTNRPPELWPLLNILRPDKFPSFTSFCRKYSNPEWTNWGMKFKGARNLDELHLNLKKVCMVRRRKKEVMKDLPPITRVVIPVALSAKDMKEYKHAETNFLEWLLKKAPKKVAAAARAERLVRLGYLKRLAAELKMASIKEWIDDFMEENDDNLLVFGNHKKILVPLNEEYKDISVRIDGSTPKGKREVYIDRFNKNRKCKLMFGNMRAAGVGWSCSSSSSVLFAELDWVPGNHIQAEARCHGIGRGVKGKRTTAYYLVAKGTIEELLCDILQDKQAVFDNIVDGASEENEGLNLLDELEKKMTESAWKR